MIPSELAGLPLAALIMVLVDQLKAANLIPPTYAGLAAIVIATVFGTGFLLVVGPPVWTGAVILTALGKAVVFGVSIVASHYSVVKPIAKANDPSVKVLAVPLDPPKETL